MPAISDDTAALVAAQLAHAWATIKSGRPGIATLNDNQIMALVADAYVKFRNAVQEVDITEAVKHPKPPRS